MDVRDREISTKKKEAGLPITTCNVVMTSTKGRYYSNNLSRKKGAGMADYLRQVRVWIKRARAKEVTQLYFEVSKGMD